VEEGRRKDERLRSFLIGGVVGMSAGIVAWYRVHPAAMHATATSTAMIL